MRNVQWLIAAGLIAATTAGCTTTDYYGSSPSYVHGSSPDYGYGYSSPTYYSPSPNYYGQSYYQPTYYTRPVVTQTRYVPVPVPVVTRPPRRDTDRDGVPDRWDRYDRNPRRY